MSAPREVHPHSAAVQRLFMDATENLSSDDQAVLCERLASWLGGTRFINGTTTSWQCIANDAEAQIRAERCAQRPILRPRR